MVRKFSATKTLRNYADWGLTSPPWERNMAANADLNSAISAATSSSSNVAHLTCESGTMRQWP